MKHVAMSKLTSRAPPGVVDAIVRYNAGRDPERLAMKYAKMAQSPFGFLRGACHLFYESLPDTPLFRNAPLAWCCGDLHFENFGSYKGDDRLVYFDINDYDEAALAPVTWDIVRLLTSIRCGTDALKATPAEALAAGESCLQAYRDALIDGRPLCIERETASGLVRELLTSLQGLDRAAFLDKRTVCRGRRRSLKLDGVKSLPASDAEKQMVLGFMDRFARSQANPKFFRVIDVARRVAGTGSLGLTRFVVLVEGKGSPERNYLIDIKECRPSALAPRLASCGIAQPDWGGQASRVVAIQKSMQAVAHAFLQPVMLDDLPCVLKGLQASENRVAIGEWGRELDRLKDVVATMGRILAWDQLRAAGHSGAAGVDELAAFARDKEWATRMMDAVAEMTRTNQTQWQAFIRERDICDGVPRR